jgi:hypothetical protein
MLSTAKGQAAKISKIDKSSYFTLEVLKAFKFLESSTDLSTDWPDDLQSLQNDLVERFKQLRQQNGDITQTPTYIFWSGGSTRRASFSFELKLGDRSPSYLFHGVPSLPESFVDRPEITTILKARLLQQAEHSGVLMVSAIHGLAAIGKSTLAAALAYDTDIQVRFKDGILWVTLGQQPNIRSLLSGWIQALGDYQNIEDASNHLKTLLHDKALLLVIDDAWEAEHVQPFLVGGDKCQVLITSREKLIATSVGASIYSLDVMNVSQSLQLLAKRLRRSLTEGEQPQAEELAKEVGYLPLALELAAAQVADGITWTELLQDLRAEVAYLETLDLVGAEKVSNEALSKRISLRKSLNLSIRRLTDELRQDFAWFGVLQEDVIITQAMVATLWSIPERRARDTLRDLRDKAILLDGVPLADNTTTYRLHDMFHDLALGWG